MEFKKVFILFTVVLAVSGMAMAIRAAAMDGTPTFLDRWEAGATTANVTTEGGNISYQNFTGTSLTDRWAGFYGNISGVTIYLTDNDSGTTDYLYHWSSTGGAYSGEICVSTYDTFNFVGAVATTAADIDTVWGFGAVADNATQTFNNGTCKDIVFEEQGETISNAINATHEGQSVFSTCAIEDAGGVATVDDLAYCGHLIAAGGNNYYGNTANYELIVPTNDTAVDSTTTYFFYLEIN